MPTQSKLGMVVGITTGALTVLPWLIKKIRSSKDSTRVETGTKHAEFGGPVGAFFTMIGLPAVICFLYQAANKEYVMPGFDLTNLVSMPGFDVSENLCTKSLAVVCGWMGFQVLLERVLPGDVVEGTDLAVVGGQGKLKYTMNGHLAFWVSIAAAAAAGPDRLAYLYDAYLPLGLASVGFSIVLSVYLYFSSFHKGALLARGGNTGNPVYDFFIGRELNPRIGSLDLKEFCELRPGLIGWVVLNMGMAAKQYLNTGAVSGSMILVNLMQGLYVWDALYQERAILTTMDITTDGFGYMLAFGDLSWVPFTYGLQARYLVDHDPNLSQGVLAAILAGGVFGYAIFRGANGEKDAFRRGCPSVNHLKYIDVTNKLHTPPRPSKLITSGWWGMARKINYTGDWFMSISWSAVTGTATAITYFYPIYFAILLVHRAMRDDHACSEKYGDDWKKYKKAVPYLFFPYIL